MEADHLAAMASLATRSATISQAARHGAIWGLGHALTLFIVGGTFLVIGGLVPERLAAGPGKVLLREYPGEPHGFFNFGTSESAERMNTDILEFLAGAEPATS